MIISPPPPFSHLMFVCYIHCRLSSCSVESHPVSIIYTANVFQYWKILKARRWGHFCEILFFGDGTYDTLTNTIFWTWHKWYTYKCTEAVVIWIKPKIIILAWMGEATRWGANGSWWLQREWESFLGYTVSHPYTYGQHLLDLTDYLKNNRTRNWEGHVLWGIWEELERKK